MAIRSSYPYHYQLPILDCGDVTVRLANRGDEEKIVDYCLRNQAFHTPWEPLRPTGYYTQSFWSIQIERNIKDFQAGRAVRLYVFDNKLNEIIAYISYTNIVRGAAHFCSLGYSVDESCQGKGLMLRTVQRSIEFMEENLGIHRIMANYMPRNQRSAKLLKRLGFVVEGYAREYLMINGVWEDHVMTAKVLSAK